MRPTNMLNKPKFMGSKTPLNTVGRSLKPFTRNDIKFEGNSQNNNNYNNIPIYRNNSNNNKFNYRTNQGNANYNSNSVNYVGNNNPRRVIKQSIMNNEYEVNLQKMDLLRERDNMLSEIEILSRLYI